LARALTFGLMPTKSTTRKARRDLSQGKSPSTAAGEFVGEEIEHVRKGKHGARSSRQAIAIGLSKARRAGVPLKPPPGGRGRAASRRGASTSTEARGEGRASSRSSTRRRGRPAKQTASTTARKGGKRPSTSGRRAGGTSRRRAG
jgi:hypothetical protein